jgi:CRP-like cAMP-binding protein
MTLTEELTQAIIENVLVKEFAKGTILLREGDISRECYFVLKGCVRCYYLKDGEEKTTEFYTEGDVVIPIFYGKPDPSPFFLECVEPVTSAVGNPEFEKEMYDKNPMLEKVNMIMAEVMMAKFQKTHNQYKMNIPEERYRQMLEARPDLIDRVPHYQIASYLGIKPESLSRIRRRLKKEGIQKFI